MYSMNNRPTITTLSETIRRLSPSMEGVFSFADLCNLVAAGSALQNARTIQRLRRDGVLTKICRGFYTTSDPNLWVLASRLRADTCISMDSVLAQNGLVGTIPERSVSAISASGRKRTITTPHGTIRFFSIQRSLLHIGSTRLPNGVTVADNEKAFLDTLYFFTKGARFVFDPRNEIALRKLNEKKIATYLRAYRNPKFKTFVTGVLHEKP